MRTKAAADGAAQGRGERGKGVVRVTRVGEVWACVRVRGGEGVGESGRNAAIAKVDLRGEVRARAQK